MFHLQCSGFGASASSSNSITGPVSHETTRADTASSPPLCFCLLVHLRLHVCPAPPASRVLSIRSESQDEVLLPMPCQTDLFPNLCSLPPHLLHLSLTEENHEPILSPQPTKASYWVSTTRCVKQCPVCVSVLQRFHDGCPESSPPCSRASSLLVSILSPCY